MQVQRIGYLGYKLYRLGWQAALHRNHASVNHWLLSLFLYYRRGFAAGYNQIEEYCVEKKLH